MNGASVVWLVVAVIFGLIEASTVSLVSIWMAAAAVLSAVAAAMNQNLMIQILVFLIASALLLVLTAPLSKKFRSSEMTSTNADRLFGQEGVVLTAIDPIENQGTIKVLGQVWSAICKDGVSIEPGEKVIVEGIEGVRAVVKKKNDVA